MTEEERIKKREAKKRYYAKTANIYPMRHWTPEEEKLVLEHSIPDSCLSERLQRSLKSIQEKRRRLKEKQRKEQQD